MPSHNALSVMQFLASKNIAVLAYPLVHLILLPLTSSFYKNQIHAQNSPFYVGRRGESKNDRSPESVLQKLICSFAFNSGSIRRDYFEGDHK